MAKAMVEVDLPDGWELACAYLRKPKEGEDILSGKCRPFVARLRDEDQYAVVIRQVWQWPDWLKAPWIAMNRDGEWFAHQLEPEVRWNSEWISDGDRRILSGDKSHVFAFYDFTPPHCNYWRQSKRKNPNA
jgi:hypothetical protein